MYASLISSGVHSRTPFPLTLVGYFFGRVTCSVCNVLHACLVKRMKDKSMIPTIKNNASAGNQGLLKVDAGLLHFST